MKYLIILLSLLFIFKGCTCTIGTYYGTGYYAPAWSPDGSRIYYFRNDLNVDEVQNGIPPLAGTSYEYRKNEWYICSCDLDGGIGKRLQKCQNFLPRF